MRNYFLSVEVKVQGGKGFSRGGGANALPLLLKCSLANSIGFNLKPYNYLFIYLSD